MPKQRPANFAKTRRCERRVLVKTLKYELLRM